MAARFEQQARTDIGDVNDVQRAPRSNSSVLEIASRNTRASTLPIQAWQASVVRDICRIVDLPAGWDTYNAPKIPAETGMFVMQVLEKVMRDRTPAPAIVPTPRGGIQFEWHTQDIDLEVYFEKPFKGEYAFEDRRNRIDETDEISTNLAPIYEAVGILTTR